MFLKNLKQVAFASLPVVAIVLIVHFAFSPFNDIISFLIGFVMLLFGLTLFLVGVEGSIVSMGEFVATGTKTKNKILIVILFGFVFAVFSTLAEPDVQVLANEIFLFGVGIPKILISFVIGIGTGIFAVIGLFRSFARIPIFAIMLTFYVLIFLIAYFVPSNFVAMAFDAGSASTGVVTAPFLIALCSGVGESRSSPETRENRFGLIGIVSIGPILAMMLMFLFSNPSIAETAAESSTGSSVFVDTLVNVCFSFLPVVVLFFVYEFFFIKLPKRKKIKILIASSIAFVGLFFMLFGLEFGFVEVGKELGVAFGEGGLSWAVVPLVGVFGFFVTFAEPAVRVLADQVEDVTNHNIKSKFVMICVAVSMCVSVSFAAACVILGWNIAWIIVSLYAVALVLMFFSRKTFVSIAFDSGGVALGPTSTAFIFPLILGLSSVIGGAESFGVLGMIAIFPIIFLESIGCLYAFKTRKVVVRGGRKLKAASGVDKFSNFVDIEKYVAKTYGGQ